ncbi:MAG: hypothetical protein HOQ12_08350, partial [Gemmatimonadaceae bacterium]|nr:hypothetical protein [Gemmatimonadaceae bacterium]
MSGRRESCPHDALAVCAECLARRDYNRRYAAKRRERALAEKNRSARTCQKAVGRYAVCGGRLDSFVENGRAVLDCQRCDRVARGLCIDCPARVDGTPGRARRCAACKRLAFLATHEKYRANHREELARKGRRKYRSLKERARRNEYKKLWRQSNPSRVARSKREAYLRNRDYWLDYLRRRREARREENRERERMR